MPPMYKCKKCGEDVSHWNVLCDKCLEEQPVEVIKEQNERVRKLEEDALRRYEQWKAANPD